MKKLLLTLCCQIALAEEQLTIYQNNLSLVHQQEVVDLKEGENNIIFDNLSNQINDKSLLIDSKNNNQILQRKINIISPNNATIYEKFLEQEVTVIHENYSTEKVKIVSYAPQLVLQYSDRIEIGLPEKSRLQFPIIEDLNLKNSANLELKINSEKNEKDVFDFYYLTSGLHWNANYTLNIKNDKFLDLDSWISLNNNSGKDFENVKLTVSSAEIRKNYDYEHNRMDYAKMNMRMMAAPIAAEAVGTEIEQFNNQYFYNYPQNITLKNNENLQLKFLQKSEIPYEQVYQLNGYVFAYNELARKNVDIAIKFSAPEALASGIVRVYQDDKSGNKRFFGENQISNKSENEKINLTISSAHDIYAETRQIDLQNQNKISLLTNKQVDIVQNEIILHNNSAEKVQIEVNEDLLGGKILEANFDYEKTSSNFVKFLIEVPAKSSTNLIYKAEIIR